MSPTVKHMNIIEHAQAMSLWLEMRNLDVESDTFDPLARPSTASQVFFDCPFFFFFFVFKIFIFSK